jgi:sugar phosphate isomerase/epimerase
MKLALSSSAYPELNLDQLIERAKALGYDGVEIAGRYGRLDAGGAALRGAAPAAVREKFAAAGITLASLDTRLPFGHANRRALHGAVDAVRGALRLAAACACGTVVVRGGPPPAWSLKTRALELAAAALRELAEDAAALGVTLAIENADCLAASQDVWFVRDAVDSPALRICLNPLNACIAGDPPSVSIKRLGGALHLLHLADAELDDQRRLVRPVELGCGAINLERLIDLLKGVVFRGWLSVCYEPQPEMDDVLKKTAERLRTEIARPVVPLSAYKGDKNAPRLPALQGVDP